MAVFKQQALYASIAMILAANAGAQSQSAGDESQPSEQSIQLEEIIVTGTLIRGVAPTGTNVVSLSKEDIVSTGAITVNEVLAAVPQVSSNFNNVRALPTGAAVNLAPSLRNFGLSAAPTTLLLMNGHRIINAGVLSTSPDPDVIPPGILEQVDVMTDGGSSIYGSDAVGGVINFITRKRFDGVELSARYGVGDSYNATDINLTVGRDWGTGSIFASYDYAGNDEILGRDRGFMRQISENAGQCGAGTVFSGGTSYALPGLVPGTISDCDITDRASFYPEVTRHSFFAGFTQELSDRISFDLTAFYTERESIRHADPADNGSGGAGQTAVICSPAFGAAACAQLGGVVYPGYMPVPGDTGIQTVAFNYGGLIDTEQPNDLETFQITPSVTFDLGGSWRLRALASYGESTTEAFNQLISGPGQMAAIASGALNPYDPQSSNRAAVTGAFSNFIGSGTQELINARLVADGDLLTLPGGTVGLAVGVEYTEERIRDIIFGEFAPGTGTSGANPVDADREVESAFAEVIVPIVSESNAIKGVHSLTLSLSGRYDHYSDFGSTTNPKIGFDYAPVESVTFRGSWGESFVAPSLADTNAPDTRSFSLPAFLSAAPGVPPASATQQLVALVGGNPDLQPQEAEIWSLGTDIDVPFIEGLTVSATYYDIHFEDQIALNTSFYTPATQEFWTLNPTQAEVEAAIAKAQPYLGVPVSTLYTPGFGGGVYSILDFRRNNLAEVKQTGIDFDINYLTDTHFGTLVAGFAGTYTLEREVLSGPGSEFVDVLNEPGNSDFAFVASLGLMRGGFTARAAWNHTEGYDLDPVVTNSRFGQQSSVDSFDTVDLFFSYDLEGQGLLNDMTLSLNVKNVFDEDPPSYIGPTAIGAQPGYINGSTLGRQAIFGIRKKF